MNHNGFCCVKRCFCTNLYKKPQISHTYKVGGLYVKILITGATGFLGSYLTKSLVGEGHKVIILKRSFSNTWRISDILPMVSIYDIDRCSLEQPFVDYEGIDVVIHTATNYDRNEDNFIEIFESNVSFPLKLLDIAASFQTTAFINTDSFINKGNLDYQYLIKYALTKKQFLKWGKQFASAGKIRFVNVKLEHIYGPFDSDYKFTTYVIKSCLKNVPELKLTPGHQKRDFIYIEDVITAYSLLLQQGLQGLEFFKEYELGTGESLTVRHFVELVHRLTKSKTNLKFGTIPYRENEIMESKASNEELKKLGWVCKINLDEGIKRILKIEGDSQ